MDLALVSGVILCGGQSSRMGKDKSRLIWKGQDFLEHLCSNLSGLGELLFSTGSSNISDRPFKQVRDRFPLCGPLGGIHASLNAARYPIVFITACDTPLVDQELAQSILSFFEPEYDVIVPVEENGRIHPLCSAWHKNCLNILEEQLKSGEFRIRNALDRLRVCYIPIEKLPNAKEKLTNINTPQDYRKFIDHI